MPDEATTEAGGAQQPAAVETQPQQPVAAVQQPVAAPQAAPPVAPAPEPLTAQTLASYVPQGVEVPEGEVEALAKFANQIGVQGEDAESLVNYHVGYQQHMQQQAEENWGQMCQGWEQQIRDHPELGGQKFDQTMQTAAGVLHQFGSPELGEFLEMSGGAFSLPMIQFLGKVAEALPKTPAPALGASAASGTPALEQILFPTMNGG